MRKKDLEFRRFTILLCALVIYICALPFLSWTGVGIYVLRFGTSMLLLAAVYSVSERRWHLIVALVLGVPALIVQMIPQLLGEHGTLVFRLGMSAVFLTYITVLMSHFLLKQQQVSTDMILGAINIYLLFAITFMFLHALVEVVMPRSYLYRGEALNAVLEGHPEIQALAFLLYFSLVTLTTLGYGDIAPALPAARLLCSLEAVIGQLLIAVFIARIVAIHIGGRSR